MISSNIIANNQRVFQAHLALDEVINFNQTIFRLKNIIGLLEEINKIYKKTETKTMGYLNYFWKLIGDNFLN